MKCRKCGSKAVINMRQHKLALCKQHYPDWVIDQTERFIKKYRMFTRYERVLVAVSGGKDSLTLWDILQRLGYQADGLYIGLGIEAGGAYSSESRRYCEEFALSRGLHLHIVDVAATHGETVPELAARTLRGQLKPCAVCGLTKRHIMNKVARDGNYDVLATGHNLDDEAAVLLGNMLHWQIGYLQRQAPVLAAREGMVRKVKPFFRFYEREMAAYALVRGIDYIYDECPHAKGANSIRYKELLNQLERDQPGAKLQFYLQFLDVKGQGFLDGGNPSSGKAPDELHTCANCGQPTSAPELCSFCRMLEKYPA